MNYIIATNKNWVPDIAKNVSSRTKTQTSLIIDKELLNKNHLTDKGATRIFFPHWSYIIPSEVYENFECIMFHMTDLPFGRGGSPLQNMISRGIYETKITAFRCVEEIDAGAVYMKAPLTLHGTAQDIYVRATHIIEDMIVSIIENSPEPKEQEGDIIVFKRKTKKDGCLKDLNTLEKTYDFIRMLDAEGYPKAFIETKNIRFEFTQASLREDKIFAKVELKLIPKNEE